MPAFEACLDGPIISNNPFSASPMPAKHPLQGWFDLCDIPLALNPQSSITKYYWSSPYLEAHKFLEYQATAGFFISPGTSH